MILACVAAIAATSTATAAGTPDTNPVVQTPLGRMLGISDGLTGADTFLGIKYGVIPERFAVSQAAPAWPAGTTYNAQHHQAICTQSGPGSAGGPQSEDCLYLSIFRPAGTKPDAKLPVLFWIHGGAFVHGSGSQYAGADLAKNQNAIVVTINYRLGPLGFLTVSSSGTGGMNGISDQALALQWVAGNIASFGGDPSAVTVFGESAGALSTCALVVSPLGQGLMHRAIIESGPCTGAEWGPETNATRAWSATQYFVQSMGASTVDDLKNATAYPPDSFTWPSLMSTHHAKEWSVDYDRVLLDTPRALYEGGKLNVKAFMATANTYDGLAPFIYPEAPFLYANTSAAFTSLAKNFGDSDALASAYPHEDFNYSYTHAMVQMEGDSNVLCPTKDLVASVSKHLPGATYMGVFGHLYERDMAVQVGMVTLEDTTSKWASHASEIYFVWHFPSSDAPFTPDEEALSMDMQAYWGAFASGTMSHANASVAWPSVTLAPGSPPQPAQVQGIQMLVAGGKGVTTLDSYHDDKCAAFARHW